MSPVGAPRPRKKFSFASTKLSLLIGTSKHTEVDVEGSLVTRSPTSKLRIDGVALAM